MNAGRGNEREQQEGRGNAVSVPPKKFARYDQMGHSEHLHDESLIPTRGVAP